MILRILFVLLLLFGDSMFCVGPDVRSTFAIVFVRSSGSTVLCSYLNHQYKVLCHDEYVVDYDSIQSIGVVPLRKTKTALQNSGFDKSDVDDWNDLYSIPKCEKNASSTILNDCRNRKSFQRRFICRLLRPAATLQFCRADMHTFTIDFIQFNLSHNVFD
jgi:hypothetical protein